MAPRKNPLNLNSLQLKTLTLLQELARQEAHAAPADEAGGILVTNLPHPHGDHFHVGARVVRTRDATGLANPAAWLALERKGLIRSQFPHGAIVTAAGLAYDTGLGDTILLGGDH